MKQSELRLSICVFQLVIVVNLPNRGVFQSSELKEGSELRTVLSLASRAHSSNKYLTQRKHID